MKRLITISLLVLLFVSPAYASRISLGEGTALAYRYERIGTGIGVPPIGGSATVTVLVSNQTILLMQTNTTDSDTPVSGRIEYSNEVPVYSDYIEALYYLPSECVQQALQGNLNWTTSLATSKSEMVTGWTSERLNFTVGAGSFESLNITLSVVAGLDSGELTLIYDVNSGIMIYEQWVPVLGSQISGDIIVFSLDQVTSPPETRQIIVNFLLASTIFATPTAMLLHQVTQAFRRKPRRGVLVHNSTLKLRKFSLGQIGLLVSGGLLMLVTTVLPWAELGGFKAYLPLSLSSALAGSDAISISNPSFLTTSLLVHASSVLAWASIALLVYNHKRISAQAVTIFSSVLAFVSAIVFLQIGLPLSFGLSITLLAGTLLLTGTAIPRITTAKGNTSNVKKS